MGSALWTFWAFDQLKNSCFPIPDPSLTVSALRSSRRFSIDLDVDAPKVALPCFLPLPPAERPHGVPSSKAPLMPTWQPWLLLDFGHFTLTTDQVEQVTATQCCVAFPSLDSLPLDCTPFSSAVSDSHATA